MRIRRKTLLILCLIILTLMSALYFASQKIIFDGIAASERESTELDVQRFTRNLNLELQGINSTVSDWAVWDDTYNFIQTNDTEYIDSNLLDPTFVHLKLNVILYFDESRNLVFGKTFDSASQTETPLSISAVQRLTSADSLFTPDTEDNEGLILFGGAPLLLVSNPILTSAGEGPSRGTLIMGRYLDDSEVSALAEVVGLPIKMVTLNQSSMPEDFQIAATQLSAGKGVYVQTLNETYMAGYVLLSDVGGTPLVVVRVEDYRTAYVQGQNSLQNIWVSFAIIISTLCVTTALLLEKIVLSRLSRLNRTVIKIGKEDNGGKRAHEEGHDELTSLARNINNMLDTIDESRKALQEHAETLERRVELRTKELSENQARLRSILSASPDAIIAAKIDTTVIESNPQMTNLSGLDRSEIIGRSAYELMAEKDRDKVHQLMMKEIAEKGANAILRVECTLLKKNGGVYPAEVSISVIRGNGEKHSGYVVIARDLTEKKQIEQRLFKSERLAAIGELAGMIGHDLRNPLTGIKNAAYYLKKKGRAIDEEKRTSMLEVIDDCVDHSNKIINDLLDYSRELRLEYEECSPKSLLKQSFGLISVPERIKIIDHTSDKPVFRADADKMVRVFVNLIKNAADAMPNAGTLEIRSSQDGDQVRIFFSDSGMGIPEEVVPKIFIPLFTTKAKGMGFGLAICKRIVEAHGGKITVETAIGKGTTFIVAIPIEQKSGFSAEGALVEEPEKPKTP